MPATKPKMLLREDACDHKKMGGTRGKSATPLHELADEQPCVMGEKKEEEGEGRLSTI